MLGAIAGDVIGSIFENLPTKREDFSPFHLLSTYTDDTVLTVAVADAILQRSDYGETIRRYARAHPVRGYGPRFLKWMVLPNPKPYNSYGNGSAMRVSPVGWAYETEAGVLEEAKKSAECTHNHPEGIKGAQAVALAILRARKGVAKDDLRGEIAERFGYDLGRSLADIRPTYRIDLSCQGSVPEAIIAFLESESTEDAIRKAISLGGDADTQACIAGAIAEAHYGKVCDEIAEKAIAKLSQDLRDVVEQFCRRFGITMPQP